MKINFVAASAVCLLLGDLPFAFGDEGVKLKREETPNTDLRSKDSSRQLANREQEDLWRLILNEQTSLVPQTESVTPTRRPTRRPTPRPTNRPTPRPTMAPTPAPTPAPEACELDMGIKCVVPEGDFRIPCKDVKDPEDEPFCRKKVEYVYKITNSCDPKIHNCDSITVDRFDVVRNGVLKDLAGIIPPGSKLAPSEFVFFVESGTEFDFCANKTVNTNAVMTANTAPGFTVGVCAAERKNFFTIGFVPDMPCKVALSLTCFVTDDKGVRTNCKDVPMPEDDDECMKEVTYAYIVTNINSVPKTILELSRVRSGVTKDLFGMLDRYEIPKSQFGVARETSTLDFCKPRIVTTTIKVKSEGYGVGELDCTDEQTHSFPINIICDVDVKVECFADESTGFKTPCNKFNPFLLGSKQPNGGCQHAHKYVYTLTNSGPGPEAITSITATRDGVEKKVLDRQFTLEPDEVKQKTEVMLVDYCNDFPDGMNTKVEVEGNMIPKGGACSAVDEFTLTLPRAPCDININPFIKCTLEVNGYEVTCLDYISTIDDHKDPSQCMKDVKYEVTLINEGLSCIDIESVTGRLEGNSPIDITPDGHVSVCPKKNFVVVHHNKQNLCDDDLESEIIVAVNGGPPEICGGFGTLTYIPVPDRIEECQVELSISCSDQFGNECEVARGQQGCDSHPTYLDLKFTGKPCSASNNDLGQLFTCNDFDPMQDLSGAYISVQSNEGIEYFGASVAKGSKFRLGNEYHKLAPDLVVNIQAGKNGSLLQRMKFHASCKEPISTRDVFGSLTLLGFGDREKQVLATDNEFELEYEVHNVGATTALLEEMLVSVNNERISRIYLELFQLKAGGTYKGSETVEISTEGEAVTVMGDLMAESLSAIKCNIKDSIEIDVGDPPTPHPTTSPTVAPTHGPTNAPTSIQHCQCSDNPFAYRFRFVGGTCEDSVNSQKFWCSDEAKVEDWSHIKVTNVESDKTYFEGNVKMGEFFEINADRDAFDGYTMFKILIKDSKQSQWKLAQAVKFDTSCDSPLYLGDRFGVIEVTGWVNKKQGKVIEGGTNKC